MMKHTLAVLGIGIAQAIPILAATNAPPQATLAPSYGTPLSDNPPQTRADLWAGIDMRAEPLDIEVLKAWEEDGVAMKVLRYRVGVFKGQKAMMAAVYGYPKGGSKLPGLVQIHGGGQHASHTAVFTNAKRGYATISIAWAGRLSAPGYTVNHDAVKLFWEGKTDDPNHLVTTDWGALDAYHDPSRHKESHFVGCKPTEWTLDSVESPRNCAWFLCTFAARRALTFLEQQPEVDTDRIGVYGHSMGGKLSILTAGSDDRVKAVAPSCGGISDRDSKSPLFLATLTDNQYLENITCPIIFLSPSNDFHGRINDLPAAVKEIKTPEWRLTISPHHNHQDSPEYEVATQIWMDHILKGGRTIPKTPKTTLALNTADGVPVLAVEPDTSKPVLGVEVYYTREGQVNGKPDDRNNTGSRFWYHAPAAKDGTDWKAALPLCGVEEPLWVYANVIYGLKEPITGAGYYYGIYTTDRFVLSSLPQLVGVEELQAADVKSTRTPSLLIEDFQGDWKKQWFTYKPEDWALSTNKLNTGEWKAPAGARLALDVRSDQPNTLVVGLDNSAAEVALQGGPDWQPVVLNPADFLDAAKTPLADWNAVRQLRLAADQTLGGRPGRKVGGQWQGPPPEFRNLRWIAASQSESIAGAEKERRFPLLFNMVYHNPGEPQFVTHYDEPGYLKQLGYNGQIPKLSPQCGLTYDKAYPGLIPDPSAERMWIERHAHSVRLDLEYARRHGMPLYPFSDVLVVPMSLWKKYGEEMKFDGKLSIRAERTQEVMRAQIEELFRRYPDLPGFTLRFGETYLHDTPFHRGTKPVHTPEEHAILINLLREEVCVKRNKLLIYRTWDFEMLHTRLDWYLRATNAVEPHPNLIFSIKHVNHDFVRALDFNTTLGHGKHQQIVEVSVNQAGLYGRCSSPYYIGKGIIEGWEEMKQPKGLRDLLDDEKIKGVWIWCWGDGWVGPYISNELWNDISEYVLRKWTMDPEKPEEFYFNEYAAEALGLKDQQLKDFRKLIMLATDATFLGQQSRIVPVSDWWCRDHYLTAVDVSHQVKRGKAEECIAEKVKAVEMWKEAERLAAGITLKNPRDTDFMRVSTTYGRIKYQVIEQLWRIQMILAEERLNNKPLDESAARAAVDAYEKSFEEWRQLKRDNPSCPTLYVDHEAKHVGPPFQTVLQPLKKRLGMK